MSVLVCAFLLVPLAVPAGAQGGRDEWTTEDWVVQLGGPAPEPAIEALVALGRKALPALLAAFDDTPQASWQAVRTYRRFGSEASGQTKELLAIALDASRPDDVRSHATLSLALIGPKSKSAAKPLLDMAVERPLGRRYLATAIAWTRMAEIKPLQTKLTDEDFMLALLVASAIANMEPPNKAAKRPFLKLLDDETAYLLYPQAVRTLEALGAGEKLIAETRKRERWQPGGGQVDQRILMDGGVARLMLERMELIGADDPLALPERFWDFDRNQSCHRKEFIQGLCRHVTGELDRVGREVSDDVILSVTAFEERIAGVLNLARVVEALADPGPGR